MAPDLGESARPDLHHATSEPLTHFHDSSAPTPPTDDNEAGPSSSSHVVPIPPPRRHKSGVLLSRVRANSGGPKSSSSPLTVSKSFGDLGMSVITLDEEEEVLSSAPWSRRASGDSYKSREDEDESMWDNSARFYHHLHSRPVSRAPSRATSPSRVAAVTATATASPSRVRSPTSSTNGSPLHLRRSVPLPNGQGHPASTSPNQAFLQQHLPPTFPPHASLEDHHLHPPIHPSMVILTPTTQEWRELKEIRRLEGGDELPEEDSSSSDIDTRSRRSSLLSNPVHQLKRANSVEFLSKEKTHTPDPGEAEPVTQTSSSSSTSDKDEFDPDKPLAAPTEGTPQRFNSFGRRESLRAVQRPEPQRGKTKRELERERFFKSLDEELGTERRDSTTSDRWLGVQEIGAGAGLGSAGSLGSLGSLSDVPAEKAHVEPKVDLFDKEFRKAAPPSPERPTASQSTPTPERERDATSPPVASPRPTSAPAPSILGSEVNVKSPKKSSISLSPTQPVKPSPLQSSPIIAGKTLPEVPVLETPPPLSIDDTPQAKLDTIRDYARGIASETEPAPAKPKAKSRRRDTHRVSLVAGRVVQPFAIPSTTALPPTERPATPLLQSFSPFRSPNLAPNLTPALSRLDSTVSNAPSTGAPSECATPTSEAAAGIGGRGIDNYVILSEAGKGAYGLVMRAKVKGPGGEPVGDEVIIKYIIKARILADCWKKHKQLGPIPVEIHVMDQLRHLLYNCPPRPHPWDPSRARPLSPKLPDSPVSEASSGTGRIVSEIRHSPERGHPNICKLVDFFEDREFYYLVMPCFGTGVDLFDRVESEPDGLEPFEIRSLLGQLTDAVRFLHANGIVHRDIKDENVILDGDGRCQLIDFGSSAHWRPGKRWDTFSGTLHYASPEILRGEMYGGKEQDIWALGVVAYVLLVGETPFVDLPDDVLAGMSGGAEQALQARCGGSHADEGLEEDGGGRLADAADFVHRCLELEPNDRPTGEVLVQHRYLRGSGGWVGKRGWISMGYK